MNCTLVNCIVERWPETGLQLDRAHNNLVRRFAMLSASRLGVLEIQPGADVVLVEGSVEEVTFDGPVIGEGVSA